MGRPIWKPNFNLILKKIMTQNDIIANLQDLPMFEGIIGRTVEFEGLEYPSKERKQFSILFKVKHYKKDAPELDITSIKPDYIKRLTATDLNFVDEQGNSIQREIEEEASIENGIFRQPTFKPLPENAINEYDFWINNILANPISFWDTIYFAMMKRVSEGYFN